MQIVGGYRLVRLLGSGARAHVFLAHPEAASASGPRSAAVKVFRSGTSVASIDTEVDALARLSHHHLLRLDDLTTMEAGVPALVLQRLSPRPLSRLLVSRGALQPGEAVSILAPLAAAVGESHRSGVAHRSIRASSVLFDDIGTPVLCSFGRSTVIGPVPTSPTESSLTPADLADHPDVLRDLADLSSLARTILEAGPVSVGRSRLLDWLEASSARPPDGFTEELGRRLFELADALPVDLSGTRPEAPSRIPHRPRHPHHVGDAAGAEPPADSDRKRPLRSARDAAAAVGKALRGDGGRMARIARGADAIGLGGVIEPRAARRERTTFASDAARTILERARAFIAPVRRSVWVAVGVSAGLLVSAAVVLSGGGEEAGALGGSAVHEEVSRDVQAAPRDDPGDPASDPAGAVLSEASPPDPAEEAAILGDDPVVAAGALLSTRRDCLVGGDPGCLSEIAQADSAAMEADLHLQETGMTTGDTDTAEMLAAARPTLVQRIGDSAILTLSSEALATTPASLLMVRSEAGWRIRDLIVG